MAGSSYKERNVHRDLWRRFNIFAMDNDSSTLRKEVEIFKFFHKNHILYYVNFSILLFRNAKISDWKVKLGSVNVQSAGVYDQIFDVSAIRIHPNYNSSNNENDLALIKLHTSAKLGKYVNKICLPEKGALYEKRRVCYIAGWRTHEALSYVVYPLSTMIAPIVPHKDCNTFDNFNVTERMICAGSIGKDGTCEGEGGGSLMCKSRKGYVAVAVNSFGKDCHNSKDYSVYTDVQWYLDWIHVHLTTR